jgi:hypothetical protein
LTDGGILCVVDLEENTDGSDHRSAPDFEGSSLGDSPFERRPGGRRDR